MVNVSSIKTTVVKYRAKPQAAVQYEIVLSSGTLVYNQNKSDTIQGSLEWQVYRIEGDKRTRMSNNATGMECYCGYSDSPSTTADTNTTDNVTFEDGGAAEVKYESGVTNKFTIIYGEKKNGVFTQLARLDVPVNVVGENGKDSPSLQFVCPSCIVRLSNDTYGTPVVAHSNTANLYLGSTMLTDTYYHFGTMGESFKIGVGEAKTINYNSWRFSVSNSGGTLTFSLIEVREGAKEAINLPIFAISASTQTQYKEVSYAIARKGDPNVSIDFDNNNATLLYNSSTGKYVNAPVVTNVSVLVGSEDISKKAIVHITTVNLTGTVKRGLNSYPFDEEGIDDEIDGEGIIGIKVTGFLKEDSSVGSIIAHYEYENKMYTATFNVTRSVGRYAIDIIATPTQVSYNQTTGLASSSNVVATINAIDINGKRKENAIFANYGAMKYRYLGETTWRLPDQNTDKLEIRPDFAKRGLEFSFVGANNKQLDYETVPFSSVTNGGDAYLVNVASMNVAVVLTSISYGTPTGDVTNLVYMTKNNAVLSSGMQYNVPGEDGDEYTLAANGDEANNISYNGWVFNYSYQDGQLTSTLVSVNENSPTSVHIPIDVIYPTDNITRTVMISYSAIQKGPAGRSYKPNTPVLFEEGEGKEYVWNDEYRDFIYYAFKVNDKGEQDDEKGALSYFMYGVKGYGMKVTKAPTAKGGDDNWEYVSEYKSIIVNCLFGTNAIIGGFLMTNRTATASNGKCGLVLDGNEGSITSVGENSKTVLAGGLMTIFNNLNGTWRKNIEFGIKNGYAVMSYYDNNGNLLYDLGPSGLTGSSLEESKFEEIKIKKTGIIWESARLDKQGQWNTGTGTIYNKINNNYDSTIFGGGSGSIPYDRIGSTFTSVSIYRYTAARINGTAVAEPSLGLSTAAMAEKADGMYFTSKTKLGNSSGSLVNLASGIYGVTSDRQVKSPLVSLADEYVPKYQVLFNSFLNGKQGTVRVSGKTVIKVSTGANGMVPID